MKISLNWLKRYIELDYPVEKISEILTDIGLEVEGLEEVESIKGGLKGIIVGEVLTAEKLPNADKLSITTVNVGSEEPLNIVCGAPNVAAGQKVLVATVGTILYSPEGEAWKIKKTKIRGEASEGMICAEDELGLGESHDGIMVLPDKVDVGTLASDYFNVESDHVFEIGLTPNRSDATSHYGVAKDLAAYLKINEGHSGKVRNPEASNFHVEQNTRAFKVDVLNQEACPRYSGITLSNVVVKVSPDWLKNLLNSIGVRPISNVVDITNFILHDLGQPLHAFDADKISNDHIIVDTLEKDSKFTTLDEKERKLHEEDLMICDGKRTGLCIGGVFGGIGTGVTDHTKSIFLESAHFNAQWIRRTSTRHLLNTDAARIFEKGSDPNITVVALKRAASMLEDLAEAKIISEIVDVYPKPILPKEVVLKHSNLLKLTGADISFEEMNNILGSMDMEIKAIDEDSIMVKVPTNKADVTREADLIEEVLRIYGFNKVPIPSQVKSNISFSSWPNKAYVKNAIADYLAANGFNEMMNLSLIESRLYREVISINEEQLVFINNTSNIHLDIMRSEPMLSGLESVVRNQNYKQADLRLFEMGRTYKSLSETEFEEEEFVSLYINGNAKPESWVDTNNRSVGFHDLKKWVLRILEKLNIKKYRSTELEDKRFSYGLELSSQNKSIIKLGLVSSDILKKMDIRAPVFYAEINTANLFEAAKDKEVQIANLNKYPTTRRDLALVCDENISFEQIARLAKKTNSNILSDIDLFDVYRHKEHVGEGKKSYAVKFVFEDDTKTLSDKEVESVMNKLTKSFEKELGAYIRK